MKNFINNIKVNKYTPAVIVLIALILIYKIYIWTQTEFTDNAYIDSNISIISSQVSGDTTDVLCGENQEVEAGHVIAKIDDTAFKANLETAKSKVKSAEYNLKLIAQKLDLENSNLQKTLEEVKLAKTNLDLAERDYKRNLSLTKDKFSSPKTMDESKAEFEKAKFDFARANLTQDMAQKNIEILATQRLLASEDLEAAKQSEIIAVDALNNTIIVSPIKGTTASNGIRKGAFVRPGQPLISLVPKEMYIRANFKETQVTKFTIGQEVEFEVDAVSGYKFIGKIKSISPATGSKFSLIPTDNATGNFTKIVQRIPVIIEFDHLQKGADLIRTGMSCYISARSTR